MPLGYFELKEINTIDILPDYQIGGKANIIKITVNSFFKKDIKKGQRVFYFATYDKSKLYEWVISLNFLRVKAIYDEFKNSFGVIDLPMNHENKVSNKKRMKKKLNINEEEKKKKLLFSFSNFIRKSMMTSQQNPSNNLNANQPNSPFKKRNSNIANFVQVNSVDEIDQTNHTENLRETVEFIFAFGLLSLNGNIQNKIFDDDKCVVNDQRLLATPMFLNTKLNKLSEQFSQNNNDDG